MQPGAMLYTQGFGSRPENVEVPHIDSRAPTLYDLGQGFFPIGKIWINQSANTTYQLTNISVSQGVTTATWTLLGAGSGDLNTLTTDDSTVITPTAGNINLAGNPTQGVSTSGSNSPGTATITVADWTTSQKGVGILSSDAQAIAGTGTTQAVTPHALQAKIGTQTAHGVAMGNTGATSALSWSAAGTNGQVFLGSTGADAAFGTLTTSTGVAFTTGAHALAVDVKTGGFAVVDQTSGTANLAAQTMYVTDNGASLVTYTLPVTVAIGTTIKIVGLSVGGWKIAQNASQTISMNGNISTSGTGGSVSSTNKNNSVTLVATDATTNGWVITNSSGGALTFV